jgi:integrase/recombinase XerD
MTIDTRRRGDLTPAGHSNPAWVALREAWLLGQRSAATETAYRRDATEWEAWCGQNDPMQARRPAAAAWVRHMEASGLAASTVARRMSSMSSLYRYVIRAAEDEGHAPPANPFDATRPAVDKDHSDTIALDERQSRELISTAAADGIRSRAIVEILLTTGMRSAELLGTNVEDVRLDHATPTVTITRKGGKRARLPILPRVHATIRELAAGRTEGPLIITSSGKRMGHSHLYRLLKRLARAADLGDGVADRLSPHGLRASFATINFDAGTPMNNIQDSMGHADPRTTRRYDRGRGRLERLAQPGRVMGRHVLPEVTE